MTLMDGQSFSQVFRRREPRFNGLIWAYHWLQVGLYEPFVAGGSPVEQTAGVDATVSAFLGHARGGQCAGAARHADDGRGGAQLLEAPSRAPRSYSTTCT